MCLKTREDAQEQSIRFICHYDRRTSADDTISIKKIKIKQKHWSADIMCVKVIFDKIFDKIF